MKTIYRVEYKANRSSQGYGISIMYGLSAILLLMYSIIPLLGGEQNITYLIGILVGIFGIIVVGITWPKVTTVIDITHNSILFNDRSSSIIWSPRRRLLLKDIRYCEYFQEDFSMEFTIVTNDADVKIINTNGIRGKDLKKLIEVLEKKGVQMKRTYKKSLKTDNPLT
jgi:hypothetical protein